eukprot:TRINITY_DN6619_c0_g1_i2.p1 TRINITY_DN6619_c0_g1~~TRINITY_DN6619_c0_g1_i2.p1  ORF type:complete len:123 (-),score=10.19 TRINITY_DN6619_c0_g1_i2:261-629(-)
MLRTNLDCLIESLTLDCLRKVETTCDIKLWEDAESNRSWKQPKERLRKLVRQRPLAAKKKKPRDIANRIRWGYGSNNYTGTENFQETLAAAIKALNTLLDYKPMTKFAIGKASGKNDLQSPV